MTRNSLQPLLILAFAVLALGTGAEAREAPKSTLATYESWDEDVVHAFENLLIQEGGRVKPIYSFSRFTLLQFSGKSKASFQTTDGTTHKLHYSEWILDVLFRGEVAKDLPIFIVDDSEAVVQIGVSPKAKRDKYSYNEISEGREKLAELAAQYAQQKQEYEQKDKDPALELDRIEGMILTLGQNISSFEYLIGQFGFARDGELLVNGNILPDDLARMASKVDPIEMLDKMPEMTLDQLVQAVRSPPGDSEDARLFAGALKLFFFHANSARGLAIFPPQEADDEVWVSSGDALLAGLASKEARPWAIENLEGIRNMVDAKKEGQEAFLAAIEEFSAEQRTIAEARGEGTHSEREVSFYRTNYFFWSLFIFIIAFVFTALSWFAPGASFGRIMVIIASVLAAIALGFDIWGMVQRSIIRQRPPITNLYDTVIFITATAVLLGLLIEWFTRIGVGTLIAVISGTLGMFLSLKYEAKEATDTMGQLVAVLDTNFWLATHVTIINIGYAAGIVAAIIGILYLGGRFATTLIGREAKDFFKLLTRMNYGVICFCLFFSLIGTVLGGIWANYSWGRFWGWDPKENGALMIVLWTLVILHGRMGGWIRDIGVNINGIILGIIVTFSWWGVNNLGVGLHSYGFTEGIWGMLFGSWAIMGVFMLMGVALYFIERGRKKKKKLAS